MFFMSITRNIQFRRSLEKSNAKGRWNIVCATRNFVLSKSRRTPPMGVASKFAAQKLRPAKAIKVIRLCVSMCWHGLFIWRVRKWTLKNSFQKFSQSVWCTVSKFSLLFLHVLTMFSRVRRFFQFNGTLQTPQALLLPNFRNCYWHHCQRPCTLSFNFVLSQNSSFRDKVNKKVSMECRAF